MRKIAVFNQKGGVGKTTTAVNLGAGLSRNGRKVIIIDLDPQGDIEVCHKISAEKSLYDVLSGEAELEKSISKLGRNLDVLHCDSRIADIENELSHDNKNINLLEKSFTPNLDYDYVLLDCPPSLRFINKCAFFYSKEIVIPCSTDFLGYDSLIKTVSSIVKFNEDNKHSLAISLIIPSKFDKRMKSSKEILQSIKNEFTPLLVAEPIRENSKLQEAPKLKKSIFSYSRSSSGAQDYWKLVKLILENENMYDTRFSAEQRQKAIQDYFKEGKKRELMMVGNKITFGFRFFSDNEKEIGKEYLSLKSQKKVKSV